MAVDWNQLEEAYGFDAGVAQNMGQGSTGAQTQDSQAKKSSLMGRLFGQGNGLTEQDRNRLNVMDSALMRIGTAFEGIGGKNMDPFTSPWNGANFNMQGSAQQSELAKFLQSISAQGRL